MFRLFVSDRDTAESFKGQGSPPGLHPGQEPLHLLRAQDPLPVGCRAGSRRGLRVAPGKSGRPRSR